MADTPVLRFAPSPTGPLHIGGIRTALYNYLFARQHNGRFILRIEDTDRNRYVPGAEAYIVESLEWMGITFSEGVHKEGPKGPYRQSDRAESGLYRTHADKLVEAGKAYLAFDTPDELDAMRARLKEAGSQHQQYNFATRGSMKNSLTLSEAEVKQRLEAGEPYVVRMKMPRKEEIRFHDHVRNWVVFHSSQLDDKILLKSDGMPTYHLAVVIDDYHMGVTHIIRGEEWLSSTPLHVQLYKAFGWEDAIPKFIHLPLILSPTGKGKLSKRHGDKMGFPVFPIDWNSPTGEHFPGFREAGYLPEAMMNFLVLLGWNPGNDEEIMDEARVLEVFSLDRITSSGANFDLDKLKWFNQVYIRQKETSELLPLVKKEVENAGFQNPDDHFLTGMINLMKERVTFVSDFITLGPYFFETPQAYDEKMARKNWKADSVELMEEMKTRILELSDWNASALHDIFKQIVEEKEVGNGKVLAPLRLALTGVPAGPGAFDIAALIGKTETVARIDKAISTLPV